MQKFFRELKTVILGPTRRQVIRRQQPKYIRTHYNEHRETARNIVIEKIEYWNKFYGFTFGRISIRAQRTRWGSCSSKSNLNFNYLIVFLPSDLQDYLIVHELCHLQEMNHGAQFWKLVEQTIPDYKNARQKLRAVRVSFQSKTTPVNNLT
ncbi:MAG: M48 family metallopeptidase [Candidatus Nomurabacteria bacterium]|nr:M48 family metallopeptidase [Candidatus Nomurabacteria bacterium]